MFQILRVQKLGTLGAVGGSSAHTMRSIETANADPERVQLNSSMSEHGQATPFDAVKARLDELQKRGLKLRKNNVLAAEVLVTASPEFFANDTFGTSPKTLDYFESALEFFRQRCGRENVVFSTVHRDEKTPHLVLYIVPADETPGRKRGGDLRLNYKKRFGGHAANLAALQTEFNDQVAKVFGLERGQVKSKAQHKKPGEWYDLMQKLEPDLKDLISNSNDLESIRSELENKRMQIAVNIHDLKDKFEREAQQTEHELQLFEHAMQSRAQEAQKAFRHIIEEGRIRRNETICGYVSNSFNIGALSFHAVVNQSGERYVPACAEVANKVGQFAKIKRTNDDKLLVANGEISKALKVNTPSNLM